MYLATLGFCSQSAGPLLVEGFGLGPAATVLKGLHEAEVKIEPGAFHDFLTPSHLSAMRYWPKTLACAK